MRERALIAVVALLSLAFQAYASDTEQGKAVFTQEAAPSCTVCHTLADAGSTGEIGPNLDELKPSREQVMNAVSSGVGVMPAYGESLSQEQIQAVADYVTSVTGNSR